MSRHERISKLEEAIANVHKAWLSAKTNQERDQLFENLRTIHFALSMARLGAVLQ